MNRTLDWWNIFFFQIFLPACLWKSRQLLARKQHFEMAFNPLLHKYSFRHNNRQLLKTLWENKKLLVTSNFFFSHNVFTRSDHCTTFVCIFDIIFLFAAEFEEPKIGISGKGLRAVIILLTLSQTSPGFYVSAVNVFWKHCGKRRNCLLQAISPFPTVFSTHLENFLPFSSVLKIVVCSVFQFGRV